ncbi:MAG: hypothetical protein IJ244_05925 [Bacteroidaceae bacterium]|nr:hypothetical protein [Bacteroidaceae bacterium]
MKHPFTLTLALLLAACGSYASANWTIQCVSGHPLIPKNGQMLNTQTSLDHLTQKFPTLSAWWSTRENSP